MRVDVNDVLVFGVQGEIQIQENRVVFLTKEFDTTKDYKFVKKLSVRKDYHGGWQFTVADSAAEETRQVDDIVEIIQVPSIGDPRLGVRFKDPVADAVFK